MSCGPAASGRPTQHRRSERIHRQVSSFLSFETQGHESGESTRTTTTTRHATNRNVHNVTVTCDYRLATKSASGYFYAFQVSAASPVLLVYTRYRKAVTALNEAARGERAPDPTGRPEFFLTS